MVTIASAASLARAPRTATRDGLSQLEASSVQDPDFLMVQVNVALDIDIVRESMHTAYPSAALHGTTSCPGTVTDKGLCPDPEAGLAIWTRRDDDCGTIESLVHRPRNVCKSVMETVEFNPDDIMGAILVYCAGCMLTVQDRMDEVHGQISRSLPGVPFITAFTFGEQDPVLDEENRHGNLMISAALFGET